MKCCTFCSREFEMRLNHPIFDMGSLCIECYLRLHGTCGGCEERFLPDGFLPDVTYQIRAKFISAGERNYVFCDKCYGLVRKEFQENFK